MPDAVDDERLLGLGLPCAFGSKVLRRILKNQFFNRSIDLQTATRYVGRGAASIAMAFAERAQRWARCSSGGLSAAEDMVGGEVQAS